MFDPEADMSETLSVRTQRADRIIDDRAMDRMLDDIERYEPTPLTEGVDQSTGMIGTMCLCTVLLALGVCAVIVAVKAVGW